MRRASMMIPAAAGRTAVVVAVVLLTLLAVPLVGVAAGQAVPPPLPEQFTFAISGGLQVFDYKEAFHGGQSDYVSVGPAWGVMASVRVSERWRLNLDYLGSLVTDDTETWDNVGTVSGMPVNQENDLKVVFHVLDVDVGYSLLKQPGIEWAVVAG